MEEYYNDLYSSNVTIISNEFLNKYLSDTKPEYIKVFLFYLWKGLKENYSIEDAASELDLDENTVEMALKFWIKKKIMKKECLLKGEMKEDNSSKLLNFDIKKQELINKNRKSFDEIENDVLFTAEKILKQTLSESQIRLITKCYNEYNFDEALIYHLFEYCYSVSKTEARYMGRVAESWYEQKIKTVDEAKKLTEKYTKGIIKTNNKSAKTKSAFKNIDRDEYNEWFKKNILAKN